MLQGVNTGLGIAVVHYRTPEVALDCLTRLKRAAPAAEVVLVDTAPEEAFQQRLAEQHPHVRFLAAPNHSYSHSVNLGVAQLRTPLVALMNADVLVEPTTFTDLATVLTQHPGGAVVAPLALDGDGAPQRMGWPYERNYRRLRSAARAPQVAGAQPATVSVSWLAGYLQLMPRTLWERVGGYDESFRFFNEDIDFCARVRQSGYPCLLANSPVVHLGGSSTPAHPAFHVEGRRGGMLLSQRHRGPIFRGAHRAFLWAEALLGRATARSAEKRQAHAMMLALLSSGGWDESPFGATLDERRTSLTLPAPQRHDRGA